MIAQVFEIDEKVLRSCDVVVFGDEVVQWFVPQTQSGRRHRLAKSIAKE